MSRGQEGDIGGLLFKGVFLREGEGEEGKGGGFKVLHLTTVCFKFNLYPGWAIFSNII